MKKYFLSAIAAFALACNSSDKKSDDGTFKPDDSKPNMFNTDNDDENKGNGILSGKYQISEYKKNGALVKLPEAVSVVKFTKRGDVVKADGVNFVYRIEGDSIAYLSDSTHILYKSGIEFLNSEKTSFIIKTPFDNTESTYKKIED